MDESKIEKIVAAAEELSVAPTPVSVAAVLTSERLVLNKGTRDGVKYGQRFLVYAMGDEIFDPQSKTSLGRLEVVKGTGRVVHSQETMSTLASDMKTEPLRTIRRTGGTTWSELITGLSSLQVEETLPSTNIPFEKPKVGDFARPI